MPGAGLCDLVCSGGHSAISEAGRGEGAADSVCAVSADSFAGVQNVISFTVYGHPEPQGSTKAFLPKGWKRSIITTDNAKLKPWRQQLTRAALEATHGEIPFPKGAAVALSLKFYLARPASVSRRRTSRS